MGKADVVAEEEAAGARCEVEVERGGCEAHLAVESGSAVMREDGEGVGGKCARIRRVFRKS